MTEQQTTEQRLTNLERKVDELEQARRIQEDRDIALLARVDSFIDTMHRLERMQMRAFDESMQGQKKIERLLEVVVDAVRDHKTNIEALAGRVNNLEAGQGILQAGQEQIITLLTGNKPPRND